MFRERDDMSELNRVLPELSARAGLPRELLPGVPVIELKGDRAVMIESHRGIGAYSEERITVLCRKNTVTVEGVGLQLHQMDRNRIVITGTIRAVLLERN